MTSITWSCVICGRRVECSVTIRDKHLAEHMSRVTPSGWGTIDDGVRRFYLCPKHIAQTMDRMAAVIRDRTVAVKLIEGRFGEVEAAVPIVAYEDDDARIVSVPLARKIKTPAKLEKVTR